ncbi:hypothetical protein B9Z55_025306 [Caenorhabditis nigoni]|uniref:Reverse transcriptase domain-containing protein n=1 Tax=Caenorhabditis nigoni TaxID=1611254 RepID=A0A2G5SY30_9PELO|nr:hypothetical protein B9Z55_025306 [Caenorhabditis nigoni]
MYDSFLRICHDLIERFVPVKRINPLSRTHAYPVLKLQKQKLRLWRKEGNSTEYKLIASKLKSLLQSEETKTVEKHLSNGNARDFFKYINSRYKNSSDIGVLKDSSNSPVNDDSRKASLFSECFSAVFTTDDGNEPSFPLRTNALMDAPIFDPCTMELMLSKLSPKVNTTPENLPAIFLKKTCTAISIPLSIIFSESYRTACIPHSWKTAIVRPLHKKGAKTDPSNYRPISLTSSVGKLMEKILHKHLISFFNDNSLLTNCQFGFRSNRGTESQLLSYQASLLNNFVSKATTHSVYIDFKKAFDTVSTKKLLQKLTSYGISSEMHNWLCSFLTDRTQQINVNGKLSEEAKVLSGVPQGSVLGPLLFLIFVNDIGDSFASNFLLYADDLKLFSTNADDIENDLEKLEAWCDFWQMSVAPSKCEAISFCHRKRLTNTNPTFSINDEILPTVDKIRDLGVILGSGLSFSEHLATTLRKAHQRVNIFFNVLRRSTIDVFVKCFIIYIRPILEYDVIVN